MIRKLISTAIISVAFTALCYGQSKKADNLGLVSEIAFIKMTSENLAIRVLNDTSVSEVDKVILANYYTDVKIITDQVLLQLIADSRSKNNVKYYKKLDKLIVKKTVNEISESDLKRPKLQGYIKALKKLESSFSQIQNYKITETPDIDPLSELNLKGFFPTSASVEELTGALTLVTSTIKDIREGKEKKVEKITSVLNELRLSSIQDLTNNSSKEEKSKKEEENK